VSLYPEIAPYEHGMLDVGDGCKVHRETPRQIPLLPLREKDAKP